MAYGLAKPIAAHILSGFPQFIQENIEVLEDMANSSGVVDQEGYVEGGKAYSRNVLENAKEAVAKVGIEAEIEYINVTIFIF